MSVLRKIKTALYLDRKQVERLKALAKLRDTPLSRLIRKAIDEFLSRNK
jgi:predicted transcriptional regulator